MSKKSKDEDYLDDVLTMHMKDHLPFIVIAPRQTIIDPENYRDALYVQIKGDVITFRVTNGTVVYRKDSNYRNRGWNCTRVYSDLRPLEEFE